MEKALATDTMRPGFGIRIPYSLALAKIYNLSVKLPLKYLCRALMQIKSFISSAAQYLTILSAASLHTSFFLRFLLVTTWIL